MRFVTGDTLLLMSQTRQNFSTYALKNDETEQFDVPKQNSGNSAFEKMRKSGNSAFEKMRNSGKMAFEKMRKSASYLLKAVLQCLSESYTTNF